MEPVPETERMEEFRSSPLLSVPTVRLQNAPAAGPAALSSEPSSSPSPPPPQPLLPLPPPMLPAWSLPAQIPYRPRTASPLSGSRPMHGSSHMRSRSTASVGSLFSPTMARTQSMPGVNGAGHFQFSPGPRSPQSPHSPRSPQSPPLPLSYPSSPRSSSPSLAFAALGPPSPKRKQPPPPPLARTPRRSLVEDSFPSSPTRLSVRHDQVDCRLHERNSSPNLAGESPLSISPPSALSSLSVARTRRPESPYRRVVGPTSAPALTPAATVSAPALAGVSAASPAGPLPAGQAAAPFVASAPADVITPSSSAASSPVYRPCEPALPPPAYGVSLLLSSVPSTPTSARSRSPSISSLETIPDSPDAEAAALEAERIAQLKAAADEAERSSDAKGRSSSGSGNNLDVPARGRTLSFGARDKRKRWSVCGAERRGDLDLETIWEDKTG